jgi:hypothetical protein
MRGIFGLILIMAVPAAVTPAVMAFAPKDLRESTNPRDFFFNAQGAERREAIMAGFTRFCAGCHQQYSSPDEVLRKKDPIRLRLQPGSPRPMPPRSTPEAIEFAKPEYAELKNWMLEFVSEP